MEPRHLGHAKPLERAGGEDGVGRGARRGQRQRRQRTPLDLELRARGPDPRGVLALPEDETAVGREGHVHDRVADAAPEPEGSHGQARTLPQRARFESDGALRTELRVRVGDDAADAERTIELVDRRPAVRGLERGPQRQAFGGRIRGPDPRRDEHPPVDVVELRLPELGAETAADAAARSVRRGLAGQRDRDLAGVDDARRLARTGQAERHLFEPGVYVAAGGRESRPAAHRCSTPSRPRHRRRRHRRPVRSSDARSRACPRPR